MTDLYEEEGYELDVLLSDVSEFNGISDLLNDPDVDQALGYVVKLMAKPEVPSKVAIPLIVQLETFSVKFQLLGKYYMFIGKGEPDSNQKKQFYLTLSDKMTALAQALKYTAKNY